MRKVFLEDLPRKNKIIDWKNSVGTKVRFTHDELEGFLEIVGYNVLKNKKLSIKYEDKVSYINISDFKLCKISNVIGKITKDFRCKIGQNIVDYKRNYTIIDKEYRVKTKSNYKIQNEKYYKYKCNKCGWDEGWIVESALMSGVGCACCSNQISVLGINTIWDTDRWMYDLGVSEKDAKKYTRGSEIKIEVKCLECGRTKLMSPNQISTTKSISCICSDKISYPEKFLCEFLKQLSVNFKTQLSKTTFEWCDKYRYDFYLPDYNMIIETHGIQHYEQSSRGISLIEEQYKDKIKKQIALKNSIQEYIVLDCRYSKMEQIKDSIINSRLNNEFDLSYVDWEKCEKFALGNLAKEVCFYWNNKNIEETTTDLATVFNLDRATIRKYLKSGNEVGWCDYNAEFEKEKRAKTKNRKKRVVCLDNGIVFSSVKDCVDKSKETFNVKFSRTGIVTNCSGKSSHHKGYHFKYVQDLTEEEKIKYNITQKAS